MLKKAFPILALMFLGTSACVRQKIYRAELAARSAAEAREKTLQLEVAARKQEVAGLTATVGGLNRTIGNQEAEIRQISAELDDRTQQMGKSASKLASEKMELEKALAATKDSLDQCSTALQQLQHVRQESDKILGILRDSLSVVFKDQVGLVLAVEAEAVTLNLPDKSLFESKGLQLSLSAKPVLTALAKVLTTQPDLDVEVVTYTDNVMPRNGNLFDTWDWSLFRATNVVRALIQDYNVNANQLTPVGRGEFYPVASNETAEGRQKNRRTVIVLHPALPTNK
ncbi:MAG: OmpA family protein [Saprospiraceae bacterium]